MQRDDLPTCANFYTYDLGAEEYLVELDHNIYEVEAVRNAIYRYLKEYYVKIFEIDNGYIGVRFKSKETGTLCPEMLHAFHNELMEYQIRLDLEKRFGSLRDQIYKRAFEPIERENS